MADGATIMLEQDTNAYAVLPESQWRGYRAPPEPPAAPWPGEGRKKTLTNKKRAEELVLRGRLSSEEAAARAANAEPWEPMPGMVKRQCPRCRYLFAAAVDREELRCADCVAAGTRSRLAAEPLGND